MPVKSGKAACDEIKVICPEMKVIFTSGYTGDMLQGKGVVNNGSNFVAKPVDPKELFKKIRQVLDSK
jgi:DNA-binding response OmpR family regulator